MGNQKKHKEKELGRGWSSTRREQDGEGDVDVGGDGREGEGGAGHGDGDGVWWRRRCSKAKGRACCAVVEEEMSQARVLSSFAHSRSLPRCPRSLCGRGRDRTFAYSHHCSHVHTFYCMFKRKKKVSILNTRAGFLMGALAYAFHLYILGLPDTLSVRKMAI